MLASAVTLVTAGAVAILLLLRLAATHRHDLKTLAGMYDLLDMVETRTRLWALGIRLRYAEQRIARIKRRR